MAKALKIRIGDLLAEFLANALVIFGALSAARTISARPFKPFANGSHYFFVGI